MPKDRNPNFEVLRVVAMLMVVYLHAFNFGGVLALPIGVVSSATYHTVWYLEAACYLSVNIFVMISSYFMVTSRFRLARMGKVWLTTLFYSVAVGLVMTRITHEPFSRTWLMPFTGGIYWYVTAYLLLCLASPFLNRLIRSMDQRTHLLLLFVLAAMFVVLPTLAGKYASDEVNLNNGYSLGWFVVLYFFGAYYRLYRKPAKRAGIYFALYLALSLATLALNFWVFPWLQRVAGLEFPRWSAYQYNSVTVFGATLCLFTAFHSLPFNPRAKLVRFAMALAPFTFAVYIIHTHPSAILKMWDTVLQIQRFYTSPWLLPMILVGVPVLFLLLCAVDFVRDRLFTLLHINQGFERVCDALERRLRGVENTRLFAWLLGEGAALPATAVETVAAAQPQDAGDPSAGDAAEAAPAEPQSPRKG